MKRHFWCFLFCFTVLLFPPLIHAEEIQRFDTAVDIEADGRVAVVETIVYDFGSLARHGIFRIIPFIKTNQDGKKFQLDFRDLSVTDESGKSYSMEESREDQKLKLKIGDPNRTITGIHTYQISYTVSGALTYFSDHDELYWNATGKEWEVPIEKASATITLPEKVDTTLLQVACYTGASGSNVQACMGTPGTTTVFKTADPLGAGEGLTVIFGFPRGLVSVLEPTPYVTFWDTAMGKAVLAVVTLLFILFVLSWYIVYPMWLIVKWYNFGRDPRPPMGVAAAWFDPPKTNSKRPLTPGETGTLVDERADMSDISATIVDLARNGYIRIIENKKNDFTLEKVKGAESYGELEEFEKTLMRGLFKDAQVLKLKDADLATAIEGVKKILYEAVVNEGFFPENPQKIRTFYDVIAVLAFITANIPLWFVALIFGRAMPRKTMPGAQAAAIAKSLKNFLTSQEDKLSFQAKNQMFFEKLLPYAVAFGVEKVWAARFADIQMKQPDWYVGSTPGGFYSTSFVNSLSSSFAGISSAATPTRSSSGFSSGFGGGGSSGGGGGGGGGGSW